jgi:hypothetical protein
MKRTVHERSQQPLEILSRGDKLAALLNAVATVLTATVLYGAPNLHEAGVPRGFTALAPLVGAVFFVALVGMFLERKRHGMARALLAFGSVVLAIGGIVFAGVAPAGRLLVAYWAPAILGIIAATVLVKARREVRQRDVHPAEVTAGTAVGSPSVTGRPLVTSGRRRFSLRR